MDDALTPLKCKVIQSTSDEAPGLLAYVAHHLGVHHSPDLFHVQHELSKAVAAPMATKQRAAEKAVTTAAEQLSRVQEHTQRVDAQPERRGPGRPPKAAPSLEQANSVRLNFCMVAELSEVTVRDGRSTPSQWPNRSGRNRASHKCVWSVCARPTG
jgi:hypothetical protein